MNKDKSQQWKGIVNNVWTSLQAGGEQNDNLI